MKGRHWREAQSSFHRTRQGEPCARTRGRTGGQVGFFGFFDAAAEGPTSNVQSSRTSHINTGTLAITCVRGRFTGKIWMWREMSAFPSFLCVAFLNYSGSGLDGEPREASSGAGSAFTGCVGSASPSISLFSVSLSSQMRGWACSLGDPTAPSGHNFQGDEYQSHLAFLFIKVDHHL